MLKVQRKAQNKLEADKKARVKIRKGDIDKPGQKIEKDPILSNEKRRSLGRLIRSLEQRFIETFPQTRRK